MENIKEFCNELMKYPIGDMDESSFRMLKARISKRLGLSRIPKNAEIKKACGLNITTKPVRTISGISPIAVMIEPLSCPFQCIYCPSGDAAKSYIGFEPASRRARRNNFDPYLQTKDRLKQYRLLGHPTDKCHIIVMGGTFMSKPRSYRDWFVKRIYDALNEKESETLEKSIKANETARNRATGLTIETRPDFSRKEHINEMLRLSATLVELGVQTLDERILEKIKRGHGVSDVVEATRLLKDSSLKVTYHLMLGLTGIEGKNIRKEIKLFKRVIEDERFRPDMLKIYPTVVTKGAELYGMWRRGEYDPLTSEEAVEMLMEIKQIVPPWMRIMRIQRDIPGNFIDAGPNLTNLRQIVAERMKSEGLKCRCIRCREVGRSPASDVEMVERTYKSSRGREFFISFEDLESDSIAGFIRLRFPAEPFREELKESSLVRELHVYGREAKIGEKGEWQHRGLGRALLERAEEISASQGFSRIAVMSGVGVRKYYEKFGYRLDGPYMVKDL